MNRRLFATMEVVLLVAGFLLLIFSFFHFPSAFWDRENYEVRWYQREGIQLVNGQGQFTFGLFTPSDGEPTSNELKQLLADMDFFSKYQVNQRIYTNVADIENLRYELYTRGYKDLGVNLAAIEVVPARPRTAITIGIFGMGIGLLAIIFSNRKNVTQRSSISNRTAIPRKLMEIRNVQAEPKGTPCPKCGHYPDANDSFCIKCGEKLR